MSQPEWVRVTARSKLAKAGVLPVYTKGVAVLLIRQGDDLLAIANRCAHMACPLDSGEIEDGVITCPCHDWSFDVRTGSMIAAPEVRIPTYAVRTDGEDVLVELPGV